jgi:hypothetical protein
LEQACQVVPEFKSISEKFLRKYTIAGKSDSCTRNYLMQISKMVPHLKVCPLELSVGQLEEYLFYIRHSYATHLLEMGLDIVSVKNQLGHAEIRTTMMYLHICI